MLALAGKMAQGVHADKGGPGEYGGAMHLHVGQAEGPPAALAQPFMGRAVNQPGLFYLGGRQACVILCILAHRQANKKEEL